MKKIQFVGHVLSALAVTWIISGAAASAQMPLLLGEILMPESENRDTPLTGTAVAVDESGQWLKLRTATDDGVQRNASMAELLEFDAADTLATFDASTKLSAEDYRFPTTASPGRRIWVYDGDPLDRGVYKRELGGGNGSTGRSRVGRSRYAPSAGRSASPAAPRNLAEQRGRARIVEIIVLTPRFVMNTVRTVYENGNAPLLGIGLVTLIVGIATFKDLLTGARRA